MRRPLTKQVLARSRMLLLTLRYETEDEMGLRTSSRAPHPKLAE